MIDKKQLIGGGVLVVALIGVSIATGKLNVSKFTGSSDDALPTFKRKLPPPTQAPSHEPSSANASVPADDVLASIAGEGGHEMQAHDLVPASGVSMLDAQTPPDFSDASGGFPSVGPQGEDAYSQAKPAESATLSAGAPPPPPPDRAQAMGQGATVNAATLVPQSTLEGTPVPPAIANALPGALSPPRLPSEGPGENVLPIAGILPPGNGRSVPGAPPETSVVTPSVPDESAAVSEPVSDWPANATGSPSHSTGSPTVAAAAIVSLPSNATGQDLLALQSQLAVLEKQKAIASGQEAIAESLLKTRKAQYEMAQIGRPSAAQVAAQQAAQQRVTTPPPPPPSPLDSMRLLSIARANGSIGATVHYNGKLVDVKKGSVLAGYRVENVTENSLTLVGERETKTLWID